MLLLPTSAKSCGELTALKVMVPQELLTGILQMIPPLGSAYVKARKIRVNVD